MDAKGETMRARRQRDGTADEREGMREVWLMVRTHLKQYARIVAEHRRSSVKACIRIVDAEIAKGEND